MTNVNILDIIADIIESYTSDYKVVIGDLPDKEYSGVLLVSDARGKTLLNTLDAHLSKNITMVSLIQLYVKADSKSFTYSKVYTDLLNSVNLLQGLCHNNVKGYEIEDITGSDIIYLGKDAKGYMTFSCKFSIKYSFTI